MIGHVVNGNQFVPLLGNNAGEVFLQLVVVFGRNEVLPAFNRKNDMDINLCVRVCHAPNMSLPWSLGNVFWALYYIDHGPLDLSVH